MNKKRLFKYIKTQNQSKLLELLSLAFDTMDTKQRHDVFGNAAEELPPSSVDGEEILNTIEQFYEKSMAGYYYAPFDINSKNFSDIPEETDAWFDEISDYLEDSSRLTDQGEHEMAVQCFKLLHELIDKMEDGDEIVHGKRSISADTALRLGRFFGTSPQFWLNLQTRFDLEVTEDLLAERLEKEVQLLSSNAA